MRILLTRPTEAAGRTAHRLSALGMESLVAPILEAAGVQYEALNAPVDAVIATSALAFRFADGLAAPLRGLPLYVVGEKSAAAARRDGWTTIAHLAPTSDDLVETLLASPESWRWLYLAGAPRRPTIERAMELAGRALAIRVVYETRIADVLPAAAARALQAGEIDAVLHYSPRSALAFRQLACAAGLEREASALLHVAISAAAAAPLRGWGQRVRAAKAPSENSMLESLTAPD